MNGSDALSGGKGPEIWQGVPTFLYHHVRFGSFHVAEPDSSRPPHFGRLLRLLTDKGRSREDAEDLIQEAMLHLHLYVKSDMVENEEAFLIHAARNLAIDHYRRDRSTEGRVVQIEDVDRQYPLIAQSPTPDQILDGQQRLDQLTALLDSVNPRTREIYMARQSGYTCAEIASDMGIAEITVKRHITRARSVLRKHVEK